MGAQRTIAAIVVVGVALGVVIKMYKSEEVSSSISNRDYMMNVMIEMRDWMGYWAIPVYVALHTITLALCLPYAVFFEAGASLLFGFFPALLCVFSAKILAASFSFFLGRLIFRSSSTAIKWVQRNRYFHILSKGVEKDVIGCLPMILQNTSIGSLASAAVASASGTHKPKVWSYIFPLIGISSSILISFRIRRYSTNISVAAESSSLDTFQ